MSFVRVKTFNIVFRHILNRIPFCSFFYFKLLVSISIKSTLLF